MSFTPPGPPLPPLPPPPAAGPRPQGSRNGGVLALLIGVLVLAVAGAGFAGWKLLSNSSPSPVVGSASPSATPTRSTAPKTPLPATNPALARFYHQKLAWHDCNGNLCASMLVPLDYANPAGQTLKIAVLKVPASDPSSRVGALVVNPGGPGGSGVQFASGGAQQFGTALADHFDIVGFDPRGVGSSDPVHCLPTAGLDATLAYDPDPDTAAERAGMDALLARFGSGCLAHSGALARHMSTKEAAHDMDILRAALGEAKLDYLGSSYGTFLGATYANEFPTHVGRFVLDGAIDPALSNAQLSLEQSRGFETALRSYIADCINQGSCFLGRTVDDGTHRIQAFLRQLDAASLPTGGSRRLTEGLGMVGIWMPLYVKSYWPSLTQALKQALNGGDGSALLALSDLYTSRGPSAYNDNSIEALYTVNCLDHDDYIPTADVPAHFAQFEKASPTFGRAFAFSLSTCSTWPIRSGQHTVALHAQGAPPIVVVGTTRDPATPLVWAQALARELDSGRLITRNGDGHTGFQRGNPCVDDAVESWLISGTVPQRNLMC